MWRDPWLLSQMMLQALYTLPVGVVLWRNGGATGAAGVAFGPTLVVIAGQLAGSLAWIALSAEDAPDFLATAPATRGQIERGKARRDPPLPVALVMTPPLLALGLASPWGALCALVCGVGASRLGRAADAVAPGAGATRPGAAPPFAIEAGRAGEHWLSLLWASATASPRSAASPASSPSRWRALTLWLISRGGGKLKARVGVGANALQRGYPPNNGSNGRGAFAIDVKTAARDVAA